MINNHQSFTEIAHDKMELMSLYLRYFIDKDKYMMLSYYSNCSSSNTRSEHTRRSLQSIVHFIHNLDRFIRETMSR